MSPITVCKTSVYTGSKKSQSEQLDNLRQSWSMHELTWFHSIKLLKQDTRKTREKQNQTRRKVAKNNLK